VASQLPSPITSSLGSPLTSTASPRLTGAPAQTSEPTDPADPTVSLVPDESTRSTPTVDPTSTANPTSTADLTSTADPTGSTDPTPTGDATNSANVTAPQPSGGPTDSEAQDAPLTVAAMCGAAVPAAVYAAPGDTGSIALTWRQGGDVLRVDRGLLPQGSSPWPGVTFDADGQPVSWPGWVLGADGEWSFDPAEAALTRGISVEVVWTPQQASGAGNSLIVTADLDYPNQIGPVGADVPCGPPVAYYGGGAGSGADDGVGGDAGGELGETSEAGSTAEPGMENSPVAVTTTGGALAASGGKGIALLSVMGMASVGVGVGLLVIGFRPRRRPARRH